ncbi:MAG: sigma 54-interacting transcriptional regulator [Spirochaetales bacterium]|nr:sigma 54-interacting transcriptional regulator [Spirochaetales bacterium]
MIVLLSEKSDLRDVIYLALRGAFSIRQEREPSRCLRWIHSSEETLVAIVIDFRNRDTDSFDLVDNFGRRAPEVPVFVVLGRDEADHLVDLVQRGAAGWLPTPLSSTDARQRLLSVLGNPERLAEPSYEVTSALAALVGESREMSRVRDMVVRAAATSEAVLVLGETGVGKELVANAIHDVSPRRTGPFVSSNVTAIASDLFESELFGSRRGAYTGATDKKGLFEQSDKGSIFLDEIGDLSASLQPKLLRAVEYGRIRPLGAETEKAVDVRLISATNRNLQTMLRSGTFRHDLWYRVSSIIVRVPPLRERLDDVPALARAILSAKGFGGVRLTYAAIKLLKEHHWPGNVRELRTTLVRSVVMSGRILLRSRDILLDQQYLDFGLADSSNRPDIKRLENGNQIS